jgi:ribonuclease HIII
VISERHGEYAASIGTDEAGKGEWLGPLVVAAVALSDQQSSYLVSQGVMDSKKLRLKTILDLSKIIRPSCLSYRAVTISPESFNRMMNEVKGEGHSLNDIMAWAHAQALRDVFVELRRKGISGKIKVFIDMFDRVKTEERIRRVLDLRDFDLVQFPRAEIETPVAAASIIARSVRELWIDEKSSMLNLDLRGLSTIDAKSNPYIKSFAKVDFLK